jgi:hypothetical protein
MPASPAPLFKIVCLLASLQWSPVGPANGESVGIYPAPAHEPLSTNFTVTIGQRTVPVYLAAVATADPAQRSRIDIPNDLSYGDHTSFASFDMQGSVVVTVTCPQPVSSAKLLPSASGIQPVIAGNQVTFTIARPQPLAMEVNGDWVHGLQLFANPMEANAPSPNDTNVIYFGPGMHQVQDLKVGSGKTVYVAGGAVLYGQTDPAVRWGSVISLAGSNITLRGRGIIDGSLCPRHLRNLITVTGTNILLEGVVLRDASSWTVPIRNSENISVQNVKLFGYRANADGIDICSSRKVGIDGCYLRTMDDLVVVKTPRDGHGEASDIEVKRCVLWNELAHALSLGAELRSTVERVRFSDCDVIHDKGREWVLRVYQCDDGDIHDVVFDNIRIEEANRLMSLWIGKAIWSTSAERGHIENISFQNIRAAGPNPRVELKGFDREHAIRAVEFKNVVINGQPLKATNVSQNEFVSEVAVRP